MDDTNQPPTSQAPMTDQGLMPDWIYRIDSAVEVLISACEEGTRGVLSEGIEARRRELVDLFVEYGIACRRAEVELRWQKDAGMLIPDEQEFDRLARYARERHGIVSVRDMIEYLRREELAMSVSEHRLGDER